MTKLPDILMFLSIILFCSAIFSAFILFLKNLGLSLPNIPELNIKPPEISQEIKIYFEIVLYCTLSRIIIYCIGLLGYMLVKNESLDVFRSFTTLFSKWDGDHYIFIAENWYVTTGDKRFLLVFYPLYPIAIKILSFIINNKIAAGVIISNISLILGCIYLYKLTESDFGSDTAFRTIKYLLLFPVSFFFGITYSESMFLALSIATFYYWKREKFILATIFAYFAALTRSVGILLVVPMLTELIIGYKDIYNGQSKSRLGLKLAAIFAPFIGFGTYLLINLQVSGNAFTFLNYQSEHWGQKFGFFGSTIKMLAKNAIEWKPEISASLWVPQLVVIFITLMLLCYAIKGLHISYLAYMIAYIGLTISPTWLLSSPRYLMCLFPIFMLLGHIGKKRTWDFAITFIFAVGLGFCTIAFVNGYSIM